MILTFIIIFFVLFILALVFNNPLNKRYHSFYEDQQQEIADRMYGEKDDKNNVQDPMLNYEQYKMDKAIRFLKLFVLAMFVLLFIGALAFVTYSVFLVSR